MAAPRAILHVDMDAFYASVEVRDDPALAGLPLVVGGDGPRGVVAAASYAVRAFGVHSAMPMAEARRRCPALVVVRPRMARYREVSAAVFGVFAEFTPEIEGLSLDEAYLDVTASRGLFGAPATIAAEIKARIRARTGLTASVGVAHNKLVAKIASDLRKPDGLCVVGPQEVEALFRDLPVGRLHGIGRKTGARLEALGVRTCGDLARADDGLLRPLFGRYTASVRARARGEDERPVVADGEEKQVSAEETFATDLTDPRRLAAEAGLLAERAAGRLRDRALVAGCVTLKIRTSDFTTVTRSLSFTPPTDDTRQLMRLAHRLLDAWLALAPELPVRLLGVSLRDLAPALQFDLFGAADAGRDRAEPERSPNGARAGARLDPALDRIRARFGATALKRASSVAKPAKPPGG